MRVKERIHISIYVIVTLIVSSVFYFSFRSSGLLPDFKALNIETLKNHFANLEAKNLIWLLGLPGLIGLLILRKRSEYGKFFVKIFKIILLVTAIPISLGLWSSLNATTSTAMIALIFLVIWPALSLFGAFTMTQAEYVFGGYKKDTAWRETSTKRNVQND